ncbi:MAG: desulfoferrodoxin [Bacteroidales bacterium]|nr:desulfoferrodoxin [Bacteroidales bacterium]
METKFYRCKICGNVILKLTDSGVTPHCCGREMEELEPITKDVYMEKHLPVVTRIDEHTIVVDVSSYEHPMLPEHYIEWIYVETKNGGRFKKLTATSKPHIRISCKSDPIAVYAYCNIHGLWKTDNPCCKK